MMFIQQASAEECDAVVQKLGGALKILDRKRYAAKCYTVSKSAEYVLDKNFKWWALKRMFCYYRLCLC
jgi:hypothetical protein